MTPPDSPSPDGPSLDGWTLGSHTADAVTHPTYRKGSGPGSGGD